MKEEEKTFYAIFDETGWDNPDDATVLGAFDDLESAREAHQNLGGHNPIYKLYEDGVTPAELITEAVSDERSED